LLQNERGQTELGGEGSGFRRIGTTPKSSFSKNNEKDEGDSQNFKWGVYQEVGREKKDQDNPPRRKRRASQGKKGGPLSKKKV